MPDCSKGKVTVYLQPSGWTVQFQVKTMQYKIWHHNLMIQHMHTVVKDL